MAIDTDIVKALRHVVDPELGMNIVDLGLVYGLQAAGSQVHISMTMTSPVCPLGDYLRQLVASAVRQHVPNVTAVDVVFKWEPPWEPGMMSDAARRQLGEGSR